MSIAFKHLPKGNTIGSGSYVFRHYGDEAPVGTAGVTFNDDQFYTWEQLHNQALATQYGYNIYAPTEPDYELSFEGIDLWQNQSVKNVVMKSTQIAFDGCLQGTTVEEATVYGVNSGARAMFQGCRSLTKITMYNTTAIPAYFLRNTGAITDIYYDSTIAAWNALTKLTGWNTAAGSFVVHCTDGDIQY